MNSYLYNLIFGAYADYEESGVKPEWGLYRDASHTEQDYHGDFADSWATKRLYLFNPANQEWQDYYLDVTEEALAIFPYDGIQVDSLGGRGVLYDYNGTAVELKDTYASLLNRMTDELDTRVIFNPVSGYGMMEALKDTDYDIVYEEVWPWETGTYGSLKSEVDYLRGRMKDDTGIVIDVERSCRGDSPHQVAPFFLGASICLNLNVVVHVFLGYFSYRIFFQFKPGTSLPFITDCIYSWKLAFGTFDHNAICV